MEKAISARLRELAGAVEQTAAGAWRFTIANGRRLPAEARLGGGWLRLASFPGPAAESASHWEMLAANASLPGLAKLALDPMTGQPRLRAEAPVETDADCLEQLAASFEGFERAVALLSEAGEMAAQGSSPASIADARCERCPPASGRPPATEEGRPVGEPMPWAPAAGSGDRRKAAGENPSSSARPAGAELADLCAEAGWQPLRHDDDGCIVQLESSRAPLNARLSLRSDNVRVRAELLACGSLKPAGRAAVARLLLAAGGGARMARASVDPEGQEPSAGIEVVCGPRPSPAFVGHALASLSLVAGLAATECHALADPSMACRYLRMQERGTGMGDGTRAVSALREGATRGQRRVAKGRGSLRATSMLTSMKPNLGDAR
jgi:hypothetical protein